jgi:hypothetical protein
VDGLPSADLRQQLAPLVPWLPVFALDDPDAAAELRERVHRAAA